MSLIDERHEFSDIADVFLLHGSMQSPAFLDGRLCGLLALRDISASAWLEELCLSLGVEQPADTSSGERLLGWRKQTLEALSASDLNYTPLLPDELFSLAEQAQGLKDWVQGFNEVIDDVVDDETRKRWSQALCEALDDMPAIAGIDADIDDSPENENDLFALTEHVRMTAMLLYTEQHPGQPQVEQADAPTH